MRAIYDLTDSVVTESLTVYNITATKPSPPSSFYSSGYNIDTIYGLVTQFNNDNYNSITLRFYGAEDANSYKYKLAKINETTGVPDWDGTEWATTNSSSVLITGLTNDSRYRVRVQAFTQPNGAGTSGNIHEDLNIIHISQYNSVAQTTFTPPTPPQTSTSNTTSASNTTPTSNVASAANAETSVLDVIEKRRFGMDTPVTAKQNGLFKIFNDGTTPNRYSIAYKMFPQIPLSATVAQDGQPIGTWRHFSFGANMFLGADTSDYSHSGGFGFFVNNLGDTGYYIKVDSVPYTVQNESKVKNKVVRIIKVVNGKQQEVTDNQSMYSNSINYIGDGVPNNIHIKVKHTPSPLKNEIYVSFNNFIFYAEDTSSALAPTNTVAMASFAGEVYFDYIYGTGISPEDYKKSSAFNVHDGKVSSSILKTFFTDLVLSRPPSVSENNGLKIPGNIEEFGRTAREIKKIKIKHDQPPVIPIYADAGINDDLTILAEKHNNFTSEIYVLNNSGYTTYLSSPDSTFSIVGNQIQRGNTIEYKVVEPNEFTKNEPVVFDSMWIQNQKDVENLSTWLKTYWAKNNYNVTMEVFGNPLLYVGDIVTIEYPRQGLTTEQKFVIINVSQNYDKGLTTSITCTTI